MDSASPTTTSSANRGGRPRDWNEGRSRKLTRLYLYTSLPFSDILGLLEENVWKPGKDAANKVKNNLLGNDPRWLRPKDDDDAQKRIAALKKSRRASKCYKGRGDANNIGLSAHREDDLLDGATLAQSSRPSFEKVEPSNSPFSFGPSGTDFDGDANTSPISACDAATLPQFLPRPFNRSITARQDTGFTNSTDISATSNIKRKLSSLPPRQAKDVLRVLKRFTIKDTDVDSHSHRSPTFSPYPSHRSPFQSSPLVFRGLDGLALHDAYSARFAVPGDFLNAELFARPDLCAVSASHESGTCWCRVADAVSATQTMWASFRNPPAILNQDLTIRDVFGNTAFHVLAAMDGVQDLFLHLASQSPSNPQWPMHEKNTAGQTLLHVLHHSWYQEGSRLDELISTLESAKIDMFAADVYGRSFFHILRNNTNGSVRIPPRFDWSSLNRRDAFGVRPMASLTARPQEREPFQMGSRSGTVNTLRSVNTDSLPARLDIPSDHSDGSRIVPQTQLLKIVTDAIKVDNPTPLSEDAQGRNGLHCLAEVELDVEYIQSPTPGSRRQRKRKHSEEDDSQQPSTSRPSRRLEFLKGQIAAKVDVNHYDRKGYTPLMAFVEHGRDESRGEKQDIEKIIKELVNAHADLEGRNRDGETALHIAARHGKHVALKVLLELKANPHVHNAHGLGVLDVLDELVTQTEGNIAFNARLEACRCVLTGRMGTAHQNFTILDEWAMKEADASRP